MQLVDLTTRLSGSCSRTGKLLFIIAVIASLAWQAGCAKQQAAESQKAQPAAKVENAVKESELATIKLSPKAEERLGIVTAPVSVESVAQTRTFAGEITLPPDRTISVSAPIGGTLSSSCGDGSRELCSTRPGAISINAHASARTRPAHAA